jgi:hypothetical protein
MAKQAYVYSGTDWVPLASEVTNLSGYQTKASNQFAHRNLIINGDMQIAQRGTSVASLTTSGYRTVDRFGHNVTTLGTWTMSQENDAPTGSGFRNSAKLLCTTADASPAAGDYSSIYQIIEGQNLQAIKKGTASAEQLTLSFWVKSNVTGTYIATVYDNDNTRSISRSYTINVSGTWERKVITFSADTAGAFDNDNNGSLILEFVLGSGSDRNSGNVGTLQTTWGSYTAANYAAGQVNLASATNNYWQVTGVQLEVGDTATPFEFKPFEQDLRECQRYYTNFYPYGAVGSFYSSTQCKISFTNPVPMRTDAVMTVKSATYTDMIEQTGVATRTPTSISANYSGVAGQVIHFQGMSGATTAHGAIYRWGGDITTISFSAEL